MEELGDFLNGIDVASHSIENVLQNVDLEIQLKDLEKLVQPCSIFVTMKQSYISVDNVMRTQDLRKDDYIITEEQRHIPPPPKTLHIVTPIQTA